MADETMADSPILSKALVVGSGCLTAVLFAGLLVVKREAKKRWVTQQFILFNMRTNILETNLLFT